jgi:hypothetical protein
MQIELIAGLHIKLHLFAFWLLVEWKLLRCTTQHTLYGGFASLKNVESDILLSSSSFPFIDSPLSLFPSPGPGVSPLDLFYYMQFGAVWTFGACKEVHF